MNATASTDAEVCSRRRFRQHDAPGRQAPEDDRLEERGERAQHDDEIDDDNSRGGTASAARRAARRASRASYRAAGSRRRPRADTSWSHYRKFRRRLRASGSERFAPDIARAAASSMCRIVVQLRRIELRRCAHGREGRELKDRIGEAEQRERQPDALEAHDAAEPVPQRETDRIEEQHQRVAGAESEQRNECAEPSSGIVAQQKFTVRVRRRDVADILTQRRSAFLCGRLQPLTNQSPVAVERPVNEKPAADEIFLRHRAPLAAVVAVVAVVAHREILPLRHA